VSEGHKSLSPLGEGGRRPSEGLTSVVQPGPWLDSSGNGLILLADLNRQTRFFSLLASEGLARLPSRDTLLPLPLRASAPLRETYCRCLRKLCFLLFPVASLSPRSVPFAASCSSPRPPARNFQNSVPLRPFFRPLFLPIRNWIYGGCARPPPWSSPPLRDGAFALCATLLAQAAADRREGLRGG